MLHGVLIYTTKLKEAGKIHQGGETGVQRRNTEALTYKSVKELGFIEHSAMRLLLSLGRVTLLVA